MYSTWLATHGLVRLQDGDENIRKKDTEKDDSSKDVKGDGDLPKANKQDNDDNNDSDLPVQPDSPLLEKDNKDTSIDGKMGKIKEQVAIMISEGKGEEYSEEKLKILRTI